MKLHLIGDIHGQITEHYLPKLERYGKEFSIQLGDMGVGFPGSVLPELPKQHRFLRGNHDEPLTCQKHPNYLGDFGYIREWDLFYISGAFSIDQEYRVEGVSWWHDEELGMRDSNTALMLYENVKPRIVISHDCPEIAKIAILTVMRDRPIRNMPSRTNQLLQAMFEIHDPSFWYFAHFHYPKEFRIHDTFFKCLDEAEEIEIDV
jgi:hypothetical protein